MRKSRLLSKASLIKFCKRGSSKNSFQSISAAAVFLPAVTGEPFGQDLLTGAAGRSYFGIIVQPPRIVARTSSKKIFQLILVAPCRRPEKCLVATLERVAFWI